MGGVREERFEGLMYHQGASIRLERVEASNSCVGILIYGSFFLLSFIKVFFPSLFTFFLAFYCLFSFCRIGFFIVLRFSLLFRHCFIPVFLAHVVSSLAYPNLLGTKRLGCCCCYHPLFFTLVLYIFLAHVISSLTYLNLLGNKWLGCCC
jgi:hypothetical protein